jgi:CheY-like chemotaxis protein
MAGIPHGIAADGQQVLEFWRRDRPAIILMDVTLPVLDGLDCARQIRAEEALDGGHVPIIGVISRDREADGQDCLAAGMDDYIAKPITPERVEEKVRLWAGGHFSLISEDNYQL